MCELRDVVEKLILFKAEDTAFKLLKTMAKFANNYKHHEDLGINFLFLNKVEEATKYFELAVSVCDNSEDLYYLRNSLIKLYIESKNFSKAKIYIEINKKIKSSPELQYYSNLLNGKNG